MTFIIDTSILVTLERQGLDLSAISEVPNVHGQPAIAAITASELLVGMHRAGSDQRRQQRQLFVDQLLERVTVLPFDLSAARSHALLWARLSAAGQIIGAHDLLIAATAIAHDAPVMSENIREFGRIAELSLITPLW